MFDGIKRKAGGVYLLYVCGNRFFIATLRERVGGATTALLVLPLLTLVVVLLILRP